MFLLSKLSSACSMLLMCRSSMYRCDQWMDEWSSSRSISPNAVLTRSHAFSSWRCLAPPPITTSSDPT